MVFQHLGVKESPILHCLTYSIVAVNHHLSCYKSKTNLCNMQSSPKLFPSLPFCLSCENLSLLCLFSCLINHMKPYIDTFLFFLSVCLCVYVRNKIILFFAKYYFNLLLTGEKEKPTHRLLKGKTSFSFYLCFFKFPLAISICFTRKIS